MEPDELAVEEVLVLRVVDEAHRRRVRQLVVAGLVVLLCAGGVAVGLIHRSGVTQLANRPDVGKVVPPGLPSGVSSGADRVMGTSGIYAAARAHYGSTRTSGDGRTHLEFGRLRFAADRAYLQVNLVCLPLCGHGEELTLARQDGSWAVVSVRTTWLS